MNRGRCPEIYLLIKRVKCYHICSIFKKFFKEICSIKDEQLLHKMINIAEYKFKKKGDFIVRAGEPQNEVWLMESGMARGYFLNANGEEVTDCFIFKPGSAAMAISDLKPGIPLPPAIGMTSVTISRIRRTLKSDTSIIDPQYCD